MTPIRAIGRITIPSHRICSDRYRYEAGYRYEARRTRSRFWLAAPGTAAAEDTLAGLIQAGDRDTALEMIAAGEDVNAAQGDGTTPLHWAIYKIDADLTRALLERGRSPMSLITTARAP